MGGWAPQGSSLPTYQPPSLEDIPSFLLGFPARYLGKCAKDSRVRMSLAVTSPMPWHGFSLVWAPPDSWLSGDCIMTNTWEMVTPGHPIVHWKRGKWKAMGSHRGEVEHLHGTNSVDSSQHAHLLFKVFHDTVASCPNWKHHNQDKGRLPREQTQHLPDGTTWGYLSRSEDRVWNNKH